MPESKRQHFIDRLYNALKELLIRFENDWSSGKIDKSKVMIVKFDDMMTNFDELMNDILEFVDYSPSEELLSNIKKTALKQKAYLKNQFEVFGMPAAKRRDISEKLFFCAFQVIL